jgi:hypothetical protein
MSLLRRLLLLCVTAFLFQGCGDRAASGAAASGAAASSQACLVSPIGAISDSGVGALRIGMSTAEIRQHCLIIRDTVMVNDEYVEIQRALSVVVGMDTVRAWVPSDSVTAIDVLNDRLSTGDSLRVGVRLAQLRGIQGLTATSGEAFAWLIAPRHCGLAFVISSAPGMVEADATVTQSQMRSWPDTMRVTMIRVAGCGGSDS